MMEVKVIDGWLLEVVKSLEPDFRVKYILASFFVLNAFTLPHLPDGSEPSQRRLGWPFETWQFFHVPMTEYTNKASAKDQCQ